MNIGIIGYGSMGKMLFEKFQAAGYKNCFHRFPKWQCFLFINGKNPESQNGKSNSKRNCRNKPFANFGLL